MRASVVLMMVSAYGLLPANSQGAERPNVVIILSDDQGWGDLSLNGNKNLHTPHIDSLAKLGTGFKWFYVCPVCSPTRAELLTGRYHPRGGVYSTSTGGERLDLDEVTIADVFKAAGYATGAFGKWHNGMQYPYHPNGRGFDEYYGFCSGHWGNYFSPVLEHNGKLTRGKGFVIDDFTNRAMAFMEKNKEKPFFAYLPYNTPHSPVQVPDRWWNRFKDKRLTMHHRDPRRENVQHIQGSLAMCENIDWNVGRVLKKLDELGLAENTIVVFFCDNGPNGFRWNGGMKGKKGSTDEGGVRSPLLIRWPKKIKAGRIIPQVSGVIDLLPTLADLCRVPLPHRDRIDGRSLMPLLLGESKPWPDRILFSHWRGRVSARAQRFRMDHQGKLFDIPKDPGQRRDVAAQHPEVAKRLTEAIAKWKKEVLAGLGKTKRPFSVGHPKYRYTQLPARDGKPFGNIQRSNRSPNCTYFTNWKSTRDKITWDLEVGANGMYEVEVYYTCPEADIGSTIELSLGDSKLRGRITEAHDPPLQGQEHDRLKRTQSYVKDFRPLKLGKIHLAKGKGTLTLRATKVPGGQVMDFRLMMLTRVEK